MIQSILDSLFHLNKPVVVMSHLPQLPDKPIYDPTWAWKERSSLCAPASKSSYWVGRIRTFFERMRLTICNASFTSGCYSDEMNHHRPVPHDRPFGADYLGDNQMQHAIGIALGAAFSRGVFTDVY
jgi:hypothetical protein